MLLSFTHSMSMKHPVAPQSMRACVHLLTTVSIDNPNTQQIPEYTKDKYNVKIVK
jgi:hypothetical protein